MLFWVLPGISEARAKIAAVFASSAHSFLVSFSSPRQHHLILKGGTPWVPKIYVGGLPYSTTEQQLSDLFAVHGR